MFLRTSSSTILSMVLGIGSRIGLISIFHNLLHLTSSISKIFIVSCKAFNTVEVKYEENFKIFHVFNQWTSNYVWKQEISTANILKVQKVGLRPSHGRRVINCVIWEHLKKNRVQAGSGDRVWEVMWPKDPAGHWCGGVSERQCQGSKEDQSARDEILEGRGVFV